MGSMNLASGYAAGAAGNELKDLIKHEYLKQLERTRASEAQQQFGQNQQRIDNDASQFGQRLGFDKEKMGEDSRQFGVTSGQAGERIAMDKELQPVRIAHMGAQTEDLNRQPAEAEIARNFTTSRDKTLNDFEKGLIGQRTAGAVRVAQTRQPTGLNPNQQLTQTRALQGDYNKVVGPAREMQRQLSAMEMGLSEAKKGNLNAGSQAVIMTFNKILDPDSVTREAEYARTPEGMGLLQRMEGVLPRLIQGGPGVPPEELEKFAALARQMTEGVMRNAQTNAQGIIELATANGIDPKLITGAGGGGEETARGGGGGVQSKPIPGVPGGVAELRGGKWVRVK